LFNTRSPICWATSKQSSCPMSGASDLLNQFLAHSISAVRIQCCCPIGISEGEHWFKVEVVQIFSCGLLRPAVVFQCVSKRDSVIPRSWKNRDNAPFDDLSHSFRGWGETWIPMDF
jgi:hypothetical protein